MNFHISLLDILNSKLKIKIIKFLLNHEALMSEREIASILKVSHMSVNRIMPELAQFNLVNFITVGKAHLWRVNKQSYSYQVLSKIINGISEIKEPLENLRLTILENLPEASIKKIILFGSIAKGTERPDSDIDIFILVNNKHDKHELEKYLEKLSNVCLEIYGNRLAPYIVTEKELKQKEKLNVISEINKGLQIFPEEGRSEYGA